MELTIVAVYTICDDLLISLGHHSNPRVKMSDVKVMTAAIVAAACFRENHQRACSMLKLLGYILNMLGHSRYNRRLHRISYLFQSLFENPAEMSKADNPNNIYSIDTYPVPVCDNIRISRCQIYQGEEWRGNLPANTDTFMD